MTWGAALPDRKSSELVEDKYSKSQKASILTFIVPAPNSCNLSCAFCYIQQRNEEAKAADISPKDYVNFIEGVENVDFVCIQGYEPLLPESFTYTQEILAAGQRLGIPTSLVTNGTHLRQHVSRPFPSFALHALQ